LAAEQDPLFDRLLKDVASGDAKASGRAAAELGILISPWFRGKEASAGFVQYTNIPSLRRPVGRVPNHPKAAATRAALQSGIVKLIEQPPTPNEPLIEQALEALSETLAEVANDATMDWALEQFAKGDDVPAYKMNPLADLAIAYVGIPPISPKPGFCGNSTPAEFAHFRKIQKERIADISTTFDHYGYLFEVMESLVRFGEPAIPLLRAQQQAEVELEAKGVWEVIIATISGKEDPSLVKSLFEGKDPHLVLACEVVAAAGSKAWLKELEELQTKSGFDSSLAGNAIAISYGIEGLPSLEKAPSLNNYRIQELQARKDGKLRPGLRRYMLLFWE